MPGVIAEEKDVVKASAKTADVAALMKLNERVLEQNQHFAQRIDALEREAKILREENALLKRLRFGRSSERIEPGQLSFFEGQPAPPLEPQPAPAPKPKQAAGHGRAAFPKHLARTVIALELDEAERTCSCGEVMAPIGVEVTERGRFVPAKLEVDRFERTKYACRHGHGVKTAELPDGVIDGGKYDASVYAHIAVAKYQDHLPLNRLESVFKRYGFKLPKQTMWDMLVRVDELVAQPVLAEMRRQLLAEDVLHADETSVALRLEDGQGSRDSWVFGWRSLREHAEPKALVEFRMGRGRDGPTRFLEAWSGTLVTA